MSTIRTNTLLAADGSTTTEPSIPALDQRMAKAWVNFDGTGTVAIRSSYNVSSISDHGTGFYSANFATAILADYSVSTTAWNSANYVTGSASAHDRNSTNVLLRSATPAGTGLLDSSRFDVIVFGN